MNNEAREKLVAAIIASAKEREDIIAQYEAADRGQRMKDRREILAQAEDGFLIFHGSLAEKAAHADVVGFALSH
jgi:hypothetical protein